MSADNLAALNDASDLLAPIQQKIADASDAFGPPVRVSVSGQSVIVVYEDTTKLRYYDRFGYQCVELIDPGSKFIPNR